MICYHHNDMDGKAAGYCVHKFKPAMIEDSPKSYYQCTYEDKLDKHTDKDDVFIVDLSISDATYPMLLEVCKTARTVTWIDHHATSIDIVGKHKDELQDISNLTYFVSKCACGAALTYAFFQIPPKELMAIRKTNENEIYDIDASYDTNNGKGVISIVTSKVNKKNTTEAEWYDYKIILPQWLYHIDDYDCWKKIDPNTDLFILGCDARDTSLSTYNPRIRTRVFNKFWGELSTDSNIIIECIAEGKATDKYIHSRYHRELRNTFEWEYQGTKFLCKNGNGNSWNFCELIEKYPAVILFNYSGKDGKWIYSVYSDEKSDFDCKKFCEQFGGGGHLHASGFSTKNLIFFHGEEKPLEKIIFLGGTTAGFDWRSAFIQEYKSQRPNTMNYELFNPIVEDWNEAAQKKENEIKEKAAVNLFLITPDMKGVFSIAEVIECANNSRSKVIFIVYDKFKQFDDHQVKSLRATAELVSKHGGSYIEAIGDNCSIKEIVGEVITLI